MPDGIGEVRTQFYRHHDAENALRLQDGTELVEFTLAYETFGKLNADKSNAILLFHALTGSQHAAGINPDVPDLSVEWTADCQEGWWDGFVGPGRAIDTDRFCVLCVNYLGGCYGSTGPASVNPESGEPWAAAFPRVSVGDVVDSQVRLLDHLGIGKLHAVIGNSIGGMMCISLATRYPERVGIVIPAASGIVTPPLQRIHNFEQIMAIEADGNFNGGNYYGDGAKRPHRGLALARMISHKTFISLSAMERRARGEVVEPPESVFSWYRIHRSLESYMLHQGSKFVRRFDANTYLRVINMWQQYDALREAGVADYAELFANCGHQKYLIFTVDSDVCFYPEQQREMADALKEGGIDAMRITVHSDKGHDSFLTEPNLYTPHLAYTLG